MENLLLSLLFPVRDIVLKQRHQQELYSIVPSGALTTDWFHFPQLWSVATGRRVGR